MKIAKGIVKNRFVILIIALALMVPSLIGMIKTRINYDMLTYLPEDMDTVKGQNVLMDEFGKGAFSFIVVEGMSTKDTAALAEKLRAVNHVDTVLWYDSFMNIDIPMEILPDKVYDLFKVGFCFSCFQQSPPPFLYFSALVQELTDSLYHPAYFNGL